MLKINTATEEVSLLDLIIGRLLDCVCYFLTPDTRINIRTSFVTVCFSAIYVYLVRPCSSILACDCPGEFLL